MIFVVFCEKKWKRVFPKISSVAKSLIRHVLSGQGYSRYRLEVIYANDSLLHQLNNEHRGVDHPTNVLSFPHVSDAHGNIDYLGEIFLSFETVELESKQKGISFYDHSIHILVHGLLHLIGYTHYKKKDAEIMESAEIDILAKMNIKNPYEKY